MKLTVTSWSFAACTLAESWGIARALGFGAMDLGLLHGAALNRGRIVSDPVGAAGEVAALGIAVSNLYWLFGADIVQNAVTDPAARARNEAELDRVCRFASTLGCPSIFVLPGVTGPGAFGAAVTGLRGLVAVAARHGITLTVEPHVGGLLASPAETLALLAEVPGLRLTLDYAHFTCMGFTQGQIDVLAPHAAHVHMRQARPGALQAKWGEGTLDFTAMVGRLRDCGYKGYLAVEYVHQGYMNTLFDDVLTETVRMRDHLRACDMI
ncbi:sugar phosphate isomerase/epimerase family protein [Tabrizicola sp.]|uniref:sugar phosphate isomerase/epimerase family protein n=1 Tax=Tabrizicola sp. TaxID=2005166 RepID=UPI00286AF8E7|nr:sugar phosphate isomerase/epimerase family protein [Tabrizicola sp.]